MRQMEIGHPDSGSHLYHGVERRGSRECGSAAL